MKLNNPEKSETAFHERNYSKGDFMPKQALTAMLEVISQMDSKITKLSNRVIELEKKCISLELISVHLTVKAIYEGGPATYEAMQVYATSLLSALQENNSPDTDIAVEYLNAVLHVSEAGVRPKPLLRLVKGTRKASSLPQSGDQTL